MLFRKMLRDIKRNLSQFIIVFLMILVGMATYSGIEGYMQGMQNSVDQFYEKNNLQDLNIRGALSREDAEKIQNLDEVKRAEEKLTFKSPVLSLSHHKNGENYQLEINLISSNDVAKLEVQNGEAFGKEKEGIWIDAYFAKNNNLGVGDEISFLHEETEFTFKILGIIYAPDHVYFAKSESEIVPDFKEYGYAYLSYDVFYKKDRVRPFSQKEQQALKKFTQLMVDLKEDAGISEVKAKIQEIVGRRGVVSKMRDELAVKVYQEEVDENKSIISVFTGFFILIAILSTITTMRRLVSCDRMQIGVLKAIGFSDSYIAWHYILYGVFLGITGGVVGLMVGHLILAPMFLDRIMHFFEVPNYSQSITISSLLVFLSTIIIIGSTCFMSVRKTLSSKTAELLKPETPKINQREMRLTTGKFFKRMSFSSRFNVRDLLRNKGRTLTTLVGLLGSVALIILALGIYTSMQNFIKIETETVNNFNYRASLNKERIQTIRAETNSQEKHPSQALEQYQKQLETRFEKNSEQKMIEFTTKDSDKFETSNLFIDNSKDSVRFLDLTRKPMSLDKDGIYLSRKLALKYRIRVGDEIKWKIFGEEKYYSSRVVGLIIKQQDQNLVISRKYLNNLGIKYQPNTFYLDNELEEEGLKKVLDIQSKEKVALNLKKMLNTILTMLVILIVLAIVLGIIIIYNMGILRFIEQDCQIATMKVLGFSDKRLSKIFTKQNLWITIVASLIGIPIGIALTEYIYNVSISDNVDISVYIPMNVFIISMVIVLGLSVLVSKLLMKKVKNINMTRSLKTSE